MTEGERMQKKKERWQGVEKIKIGMRRTGTIRRGKQTEYDVIGMD